MLTWKCCSNNIILNSCSTTNASHSKISYNLVSKGVHLSQITNPYAPKASVKCKFIDWLPRYSTLRGTKTPREIQDEENCITQNSCQEK